MARGRTVSSAGQLFGEFQIDAGSAPPAPTGQPVWLRIWGHATIQGWNDFVGKFHFSGLKGRRPLWQRLAAGLSARLARS